ncbi:TetR/AcrR family transcriptional regulator [Gordonia amicalis]|uniref:TetR/AcrR family transcriptional regulator n=1 Tax=Gordonia TaxID=2053 RepID=UPI00177D5C2C|nr:MULTISPECIES: TetR/AcrR family transcriptional regulator [Gordonia]MCZ4580057.1 TetR/AcrR family transcriptional regulator [Gordonia amicalis]MDV7174181.1 TetR/AcrR family transcriptional regulator [Gordonia amicalis]UPW13162.1 TetR/AcrR family transcriptional regulator [Gordonia amicalis]
MSPTTRRRSSDLQALIVVAAEEEFSHLGYKGATMAAIASRAGVTRSVLTRHFATKADLFAEVMTKPLLQFADSWTSRWADRLAEEPPELELVYEFISDLFENSRNHTGVLRLLMFSGEQLEPEVRKQVWETIDEGMSAVLEIAVRTIAAHGYPAEHADITVRALISMVMGYVSMDSSVLGSIDADDEVVVRHMSSLIMHGISLGADAGRDPAE